VNLPLASDNKGKAFYVKKVDAAPGSTVKIIAAAGDLIDGGATKTLSMQYDALLVVSDGTTNWWIIGEAGPSF
jgi:hypothetical protein